MGRFIQKLNKKKKKKNVDNTKKEIEEDEFVK